MVRLSTVSRKAGAVRLLSGSLSDDDCGIYPAGIVIILLVAAVLAHALVLPQGTERSVDHEAPSGPDERRRVSVDAADIEWKRQQRQDGDASKQDWHGFQSELRTRD